MNVAPQLDGVEPPTSDLDENVAPENVAENVEEEPESPSTANIVQTLRDRLALNERLEDKVIDEKLPRLQKFVDRTVVAARERMFDVIEDRKVWVTDPFFVREPDDKLKPHSMLPLFRMPFEHALSELASDIGAQYEVAARSMVEEAAELDRARIEELNRTCIELMSRLEESTDLIGQAKRETASFTVRMTDQRERYLKEVQLLREQLFQKGRLGQHYEPFNVNLLNPSAGKGVSEAEMQAELDSQKEKLMNQMMRMEQAYQERLAERERAEQMQRERAEAAERKIKQLEDLVVEMEQKHKAEIERLEAEHQAEIEALNAKHEAEMQALREEHEREKKRLQGEIDRLEAEAERYRAQIEELETQVAGLKEELEQAQARYEALEEEFEQFKEEAANRERELQEEIATQGAKIEELSAEVEALQTELALKEQQIAQLEEKVEQLEEEAAQSRAIIAQKDAIIAEKEAALKEAEAKNKDLSKQLEDAEAKALKLMQEAAERDAQLREGMADEGWNMLRHGTRAMTLKKAAKDYGDAGDVFERLWRRAKELADRARDRREALRDERTRNVERVLRAVSLLNKHGNVYNSAPAPARDISFSTVDMTQHWQSRQRTAGAAHTAYQFAPTDSDVRAPVSTYSMAATLTPGRVVQIERGSFDSATSFPRSPSGSRRGRDLALPFTEGGRTPNTPVTVPSAPDVEVSFDAESKVGSGRRTAVTTRTRTYVVAGTEVVSDRSVRTPDPVPGPPAMIRTRPNTSSGRERQVAGYTAPVRTQAPPTVFSQDPTARRRAIVDALMADRVGIRSPSMRPRTSSGTPTAGTPPGSVKGRRWETTREYASFNFTPGR
ncbi:Chromosome partition protein Smc [Carpediemonas membranifera]|uniref:Chromosome partition protein Smc n=1 Tax=Carpediemonas membranifera TaxID=201153 RepID=A0A8J6AV59_9EUKA|nr:Chromosome partition protein Smc [Carpediemonas membranifera]|eukprot:KAG9395581.1 Chromosome partition protein Smc [Carpediemonas membranifera]